MSIDFEDVASELTKVGDGELKAVADLVRQQLVLERRIEDLEMELKRAQQDLTKISQEILPEALAEHGLSELKMDDGSKITVSQFIQAHITKEKQEEAFDWLRGHDFDDLIKNVVSLEFGKGEDEHARDVMETLTNRGYWPQNKQSVHPSTLKAFVKEQIEKGAEIPSDLFGIFIGKKAVIKKGK
jgi:hypothetical protein